MQNIQSENLYKWFFTYHRFFHLIWFDTTNKKGMTLTKGSHKGIKRFLELCTKGWRFLSSVCSLITKGPHSVKISIKKFTNSARLLQHYQNFIIFVISFYKKIPLNEPFKFISNCIVCIKIRYF